MESGMSTRIRVVCVLIGYMRMGGPRPRTECAYLGIGSWASAISRPQNRDWAFGLEDVNWDLKLELDPSAKMVRGV